MVRVDFTIQNWIRFPGITPSLAMVSNPSICYFLLRVCMSTFIQEYGFFYSRILCLILYFFHPSLWEKEERICFILLQRKACCVLGVGRAGDKTQSLTHAPTPDGYLKDSSAPFHRRHSPMKQAHIPRPFKSEICCWKMSKSGPSRSASLDATLAAQI